MGATPAPSGPPLPVFLPCIAPPTLNRANLSDKRILWKRPKAGSQDTVFLPCFLGPLARVVRTLSLWRGSRGRNWSLQPTPSTDCQPCKGAVLETEPPALPSAQMISRGQCLDCDLRDPERAAPGYAASSQFLTHRNSETINV